MQDEVYKNSQETEVWLSGVNGWQQKEAKVGGGGRSGNCDIIF